MYALLRLVSRQTESEGKTEKERSASESTIASTVHLKVSGNSKPHLRSVPSRKSSGYLVRILLETSSEWSREGEDAAEGGDLSGGFTFARQLTTGHLWPCYSIQSHSTHHYSHLCCPYTEKEKHA